MGFMSLFCRSGVAPLSRETAAGMLVAAVLLLSPQAFADTFDYEGQITASEGALAVLIPLDSDLGGTVTLTTNPGSTSTNPADLTNTLLRIIDPDGGVRFCFFWNRTCPPGETQVPVVSIDAIDLTFAANGCPISGTIDITTHSPTFMVDIPVHLDITNKTLHAESPGLGSVDGVGDFTCMGEPEIDTAPSPATPINIGSVAVGAAGAAQTITINNSGEESLNIGTMSLTGSHPGDFSFTSTCTNMIIPVGGGCMFSVNSTPTDLGMRNAMLLIPSDDTDEPTVTYNLAVTGTPGGQISTDQPLVITSTGVGSSMTGTLTVQNIGTGPLAISQIQNTDLVAPFMFGIDTCSATTVVAAGSCTVDVIFTPATSGMFMDDFTIVSDDPGNAALTVNVSAESTAAIATASPDPLIFADTTVNTTSMVTLTITNTGNADLNISDLNGLTAPFSTGTETCIGGAVMPTMSCTVEVTFAPTTTGMAAGALNIVSDGINSTTVVNVTGNGTVLVESTIVLNPTSLTFGSVLFGANEMQTIGVTNTGNGALDLTSYTITGDTGFTTTNDCPASLASLASCTITVTFVPAAAGPLNAMLTIGSNASNGPTMVPLSGTGVMPLPEITVTPTSLDSGVIIIADNSVRQFTVQNDGTADLTMVSVADPSNPEFGQTNDCPMVLAPTASCTVMVTYTPGDVGTDVDSINVASNDADENPVTVSLMGEGTLGPTPNITSNGVSSVDFGTVFISQSATQTVTISNNGSEVLNVASVTLSGVNADNFASADDCVGALAIGADCTLTLTFTPSAPEGAKMAAVSISSNDPDTPVLQITLMGTSDQPEPMAVVSPAALIFASVVEGDMSTGMITVTNSGLGDLLVSAIASTDTIAAPFSLDSETCTQAPITTGNSCVMMFTFAPGMAGDFSDTFNFDSNDAMPSRSLSLAGAATAVPSPDIMLSVSSLDLGSVLLGSSATMSVTISNIGNADLTVSAPSIAPMGDFSVVNNCAVVMAGADCTIDVTYTPMMAGAASATLTVTSDDPDMMDVPVMLSGAGVTPDPEISVSPSMSADLGSVVVGATSSADVVVSNDGTADLIIGMITISGTNAAEFSQTNNCATVAAGATCTIAVIYAPAVAGNATAALSIPSNDADEATVDVALTGIATIAMIPMLSAPAAVDVGDVEVGMSGTADIVITNDGTADLSISNVAISGANAADFAIAGDACSTAPVASMANCTITVAYNPLVVGTGMATVTITSNDAANPMTDIAVTGTGIVVVAVGSIDVSGLNFGGVALGQASTQVLTITNSGNGVLKVTGVSISGADAASFSAPNVCATIAPASACNLVVSYAPTAGSSGAATLTVTTDDPALASVAIQLSAAIEEVVVSVTSSAGKGSFGWLELCGLGLFVAWVRRRKLVPLLAIAGLMASGAVHAEEQAKSGYWYIGAGSGSSTGQADEGNVRRAIESAGVSVTRLSIDDSDNGWKAFVGYQASERLAIEVGYADLGTAGVDLQLGSVSVQQLPLVSRVISNNLSLLGNGMHGSVVFKQPFKENLAVFARVGLMAWEIESSISGTAGSGSINVNQVESGTDIMFGVGAEMWLEGSRFGLTLEWERYEFGRQDAELLTLNGKFRF